MEKEKAIRKDTRENNKVQNSALHLGRKNIYIIKRNKSILLKNTNE